MIGNVFAKKVYEKEGASTVSPPKDIIYKGASDGWKLEKDGCFAAIEGFGGEEREL